MKGWMIALTLMLAILVGGAGMGCLDNDDDDDNDNDDDDNTAPADDDDDNDDDDDDDNDDDDDDDNDDDDDDNDNDDNDNDDNNDTTSDQCCRDGDADGFGDPDACLPMSTPCPGGMAPNGQDCNDADSLTYPGAPELAGDGIDQSCDGLDLTPTNNLGVFVALTGDDANPGTKAAPKASLTAGIAAAESDGKVVFVAGGTYRESVSTTVSIHGGYNATTWTRTAFNPTIVAGAQGVSFTVTGGVPIAVERMTVLSGYIDQASLLVDTDGRLLLADAVVVGLFDVNGGRATLLRNVIEGGVYTGAVRAQDAWLEMVDNLVLSPWWGSLYDTDAWLIDNTFLAMAGRGLGTGGPSVSGGHVVLVNNVLANLSAYPYTAFGATPTSAVVLRNNDFWSITPITFDYDPITIAKINACAWDGCVEAGGNIFAYPQFGVTAIAHLAPGSPCIDAGAAPGFWYARTLANHDWDGDARPFGVAWDIGLDEFVGAP